jgi:drug/metabolite transporter (DMT)-like permease
MLENLKRKIPENRKGLIYISITAFLWSTSGLFIKILSTGPFQIAMYRSLIASVTVFFLVLIKDKKVKIDKDAISVLSWIAYAGILIFFVVANRLTKAANVIFLQFTAPIYLLFLEPIFLKSKFKVKDLVTILISFTGMSLFFFGKLEPGDMKGNIIAILAGICFAFFSLFVKWKKQLHKSENTISSIIAGNFLVFLICFPIVMNELSLTTTDLIILIYMGAIQIGLSYTIFNAGLKYVSATESMIIATLEAVFNPIWVFFGVGEVPGIYAIIGSVIIVLAILWNSLSIKN